MNRPLAELARHINITGAEAWVDNRVSQALRRPPAVHHDLSGGVIYVHHRRGKPVNAQTPDGRALDGSTRSIVHIVKDGVTEQRFRLGNPPEDYQVIK